MDRSRAEFALAPGGYASYRGDGFVVGRSDPKRDWPYVQPGPDDNWAGSRSHAFSVVFGVKARPSGSGTCTLELALVDARARTTAPIRRAPRSSDSSCDLIARAIRLRPRGLPSA